MESSLKDEIEAGGSLLNQANAKPFSLMAKALHRTGVLIYVQLYLILVGVEVVYGILCLVKGLDLRHPEFLREREV